MPRRPTFIRLSDAQRKEVTGFIHYCQTTRGKLRDCIHGQVIWFSDRGLSVSQIARRLHIAKSVVWKCFKNYREKGIEGLKGARNFTSHKY
ncbi:MAG: helix-turn-helix domain-containing protein [Planctomycetes bacterium]|nr:helix-turn-helix domain-containing protein [Planctomycetota bacterium]